MHVISFITSERKCSIKMILSHTCKNAMLSTPTKTKVEVSDEGSLHSFSIGMHDMKNPQTKCEWIASAYVVLVWTLTLKSKNSAKIGSPVRHLSQDRFFALTHRDRSRLW